MLSKMCQNAHCNGFFRFAVLRRKTSQGVQTMKCNTFYSEDKFVKTTFHMSEWFKDAFLQVTLVQLSCKRTCFDSNGAI